MGDILGYDVDKKPVRVGDRVMLVTEKIRPEWRGKVFTVAGPFDAPTVVRFITGEHGPWVRHENMDQCTPCACLKIIPRINDANEKTTWQSIQDGIGWSPVPTTQRPEVPA